jgi:hypothetical protein
MYFIFVLRITTVENIDGRECGHKNQYPVSPGKRLNFSQ